MAKKRIQDPERSQRFEDESTNEEKEIQERGDVVMFEEGVRRITERILVLLDQKDFVTFSVYGPPNSGKTYFASEVMKKVREVFPLIFGGEIHGYDELPDSTSMSTGSKWVMLVQHLYWPAERVLEDEAIKSNCEESNAPLPDGSLALCARSVSTSWIETLCARVDLVIKNPASYTK